MFLPSYYKAMRFLPDIQRLELFDAMVKYGLEREEPSIEDPVVASLFEVMRPNIDSGINRYLAAKRNGEKGGRPSNPDIF